MTWTLKAHTQVAGTGSVTTPAIDTTGADLIVIVAGSPSIGETLSDNKSNTYSVALTFDGSGFDCIYYAQAPTVGAGHTFTVSGGTLHPISVQAWSGSAASPLDQTGLASGTGTTSAGSITPTEDGELLITGMLGASNTNTFTIDNGFAITDQVGLVPFVNYAGSMAYLVQSGAANIDPTWTCSGQDMRAGIASFKAAAAGTMITSDIVSPVSFQGRVARGEENGIEWLSQASMDRGVLGEWGVSSLLDITAPSEWLSGWSGDRGTPSEWLSATLRDIVTPDEALSQASVDGNLTGEWTGLAFMDMGAPTESLVHAVIDRGVPGEWLGSSLLTSVAPFEFVSALVVEPLAPVEFEREILFVSETAVSIEWLGSFLLDRGLPMEALLEAAADRRMAMEWLASAILDTALSGEFAASLAGDNFVPIEFEGNIRLISDRVFPIEWSALPAIVQVSLERLLASSSKRRILGAPGRLRLLKRQ